MVIDHGLLEEASKEQILDNRRNLAERARNGDSAFA